MHEAHALLEEIDYKIRCSLSLNEQAAALGYLASRLLTWQDEVASLLASERQLALPMEVGARG